MPGSDGTSIIHLGTQSSRGSKAGCVGGHLYGCSLPKQLLGTDYIYICMCMYHFTGSAGIRRRRKSKKREPGRLREKKKENKKKGQTKKLNVNFSNPNKLSDDLLCSVLLCSALPCCAVLCCATSHPCDTPTTYLLTSYRLPTASHPPIPFPRYLPPPLPSPP